MADRPQTTAFPAPPPFYEHFTKKNLELHKRKLEDGTPTIPAENQNAQTQEEERFLAYLEPPKIPNNGKWRAFGVEHELEATEPSLQDAGMEQLFPDHPSIKLAPQAYLLSMARSLLTTFLSLTGTLAQNPTSYAEKVEDLRTIAINMHYLINQYRPHQARETLIGLMEDRLDSLRAEVEAIQNAKERLADFVQRVQAEHTTILSDNALVDASKKVETSTNMDDQSVLAIWEVLDSLSTDTVTTSQNLENQT